MEEATGAPSSFAVWHPRRLRASGRDGGGVMNRSPSPLSMLLSRHTRSPVTVVVISSDGEGNRSVESLEVKVPEGWVFQSDPCRGASKLAGRSGSEPVKPRNPTPAWNGLRECWECRAVGQSAKAMSASNVWNISMSDSSGSERTACQEGMRSESSEPLAGRLGAPAQRRHRV